MFNFNTFNSCNKFFQQTSLPHQTKHPFCCNDLYYYCILLDRPFKRVYRLIQRCISYCLKRMFKYHKLHLLTAAAHHFFPILMRFNQRYSGYKQKSIKTYYASNCMCTYFPFAKSLSSPFFQLRIQQYGVYKGGTVCHPAGKYDVLFYADHDYASQGDTHAS